jgi:TolB-like protein
LLARETGTSAVETAQRLVTLDPLQEEGHRALMRLYAEAGEIGVALRQYEVCREILERELAVAPSPETDKLHRRLRSQQRVSGPAVATPIQDREQEPPPSATAPQHPPSNKFSIAVLPFTNMSGDPEQEYFCDSITEDIITELARDRSLLVIARNSCFQFRGPSVDIAAVRWALGVRYIVEGSVRKASGRIRVTAQLIDAVTQSHVWAERYDRDIQDIFAVQDQVTRAIVATLGGRIVASGAEQSRCKPTKNWVAHDYYLQGRNRDHASTMSVPKPSSHARSSWIPATSTPTPGERTLWPSNTG